MSNASVRDVSSRVEENFATNLREYRETQGVSQEELARRMTARGFGFSQATVWKIEQNKRPVRLGEATALAAALQVPRWRSLIAEPDQFRHGTNIDGANRWAGAAYHQVKAAAADYVEAQLNLAVVIREVTDAGYEVPEFRRAWLDQPPERAVLEARVEAEHRDQDAEHIHEEVERVLTVLRSHGHEDIFDPADVTTG